MTKGNADQEGFDTGKLMADAGWCEEQGSTPEVEAEIYAAGMPFSDLYPGPRAIDQRRAAAWLRGYRSVLPA